VPARRLMSGPRPMPAPRPTAARRTLPGRWLAVAGLVLAMSLTGLPAAAGGAASSPPSGGLPDGRAYELVTRTEGPGGHPEGVSGISPGFLASSAEGNAVDWEGFGGCCGSGSAGLNLFRSVRGSAGWRAEALTPKPAEPLTGLAVEQAPMSWSSNLESTLFATPASYYANDHRPRPGPAEDLYLEQGSGSMDWVSQGPTGTGSKPVSAELDGATPDLGKIVFSSAEPLTADAKGLGAENMPPQYLYLRDVDTNTTELLDVDSGDALISKYGAVLGNGAWLHEEASLPAGYTGTTTNAISQDGTKTFFEAPPPGDWYEGAPEAHLYMRDLATGTTTPLDEPSSSGSATYQGASADGSLVFFTSDEGLDGAAKTEELYEFNTTSSQIGAAPAMSAIAIADGEGVVGESAIADSGSTVYFVSDRILASNANPVEATAQEGQPNLYSYDTGSGLTTYVATLAWPDVSACDPICAKGHPTGLVAQPDTARPAYPTPDGSVLVFASYGDLTTEPTGGAQTTLISEARYGKRTLTVASTDGFHEGQTIAIGEGAQAELDTIEAVAPPKQITLSEYGPDGFLGLVENHPAGSAVTWLHTEVYRYAANERSLLCVSCLPSATTQAGGDSSPAFSAGGASLGPGGPGGAGGSYAPGGHAAPLSESGASVFFESPDPLVPEAQPAPASEKRPPSNVYEWESGHVHLISDGSSAGFTLDGSSPSGADVYFTTKAQLTGVDTNGDREIYDARIGGGISEGPVEEGSCQGAACQISSAGGIAIAAPPLPGSAILGAEGGLEEQGPSATPKLSIARTTAAQRRRFARTGRILLTVAATGPDAITVDASARIRSRTRRVARGSVTVAKAMTVVLGLTLDSAARLRLASAGTLTLRLAASDSAGAPKQTFALVLRAPASSSSDRARVANESGRPGNPSHG
jgi:hypothetical protein